MAKEAKVVEADYELKLEEAEKLIRRLRRDNDDQRKEVNIFLESLELKNIMFCDIFFTILHHCAVNRV